MHHTNTHNIAFFGTPHIAVAVLEELEKAHIVPNVIITSPDSQSGRGLELSIPQAKIWAQERSIPVLQPAKLNEAFIQDLKALSHTWDLFLVAAYGKIIPQAVLDIPTHGTLNVHPSLLPRYRGASPIISQILQDEKEVGVSIMLLDEKMDHGPILSQKQISIESWPPKARTLEHILSHEGGKLLGKVIPDWISGSIQAQAQDHSKATFTQKIIKEDGLLDLQDDPYTNFLKIQAFDVWPRTYFFAEKNGKNIRVIITDADYKDGELIIKKVLPEGKKETTYENFLNSLN